MNIFARLFSDLLIITSTVFCWNYCMGLKVRDNLKKNVLLIILLTALIAFIATFIKNPFKLIITLVGLILINYFSTTKNITKSVIQVIISQLCILISELIFFTIISVIAKTNFEKIMNIPIIFITLNLFIFISSLVLLKAKIPQRIYMFIQNLTETIKNKEILMYSMMILAIMIISTFETYLNLPTYVILITNTIIAAIIILIIVKFVSTKNKLNNISNKYQTSITSIREFEELIDKNRINNHENKNELLTIRNMIKDKKTIKYIDTLIDNKTKDNNKIMIETYKIPEGGLRATIYSKLCTMDKYKIKYRLNVSKVVKTEDLIELSDELILNICKILGVFLDNSIEAVKNLKEKQIIIEIYIMDKKLNIEITNNFEGSIDINKISKTKYTTKGDGHGYGLSLVNKIINENKNLMENEKEINGSNFTQILKIRM